MNSFRFRGCLPAKTKFDPRRSKNGPDAYDHAGGDSGYMPGRSPTASLRLLWMKRQLLSLHPLNQSLDPINRWLICEPGRQETMVLDLAVKFDALVTHRALPLQPGTPKGPTVDRLQSQSRPVPWRCGYSSDVPMAPVSRGPILYGARFTSDYATIRLFISPRRWSSYRLVRHGLARWQGVRRDRP
jgi:hypothetical protein